MNLRIRIRSKQVIGTVLALSAAEVGIWAEFAPKSFYDSFPLTGHHWISSLGPYNEHMTRDVGGMYLALLAISAWAALRPRAEAFALVGAGWLAFSIPHFIYHMFHLDMYDTADQIGNIVTLGGTIILATLLMLPVSRSAAGDAGRGGRDVIPHRDGRSALEHGLAYAPADLARRRSAPSAQPQAEP